MTGLVIVPRATWGARHAAGFAAVTLPLRDVWLHHSVTRPPAPTEAAERTAMRALEAIGQQRFGGGVSYTFAVMPSGRVYEGTGPGRRGAHTGGRNSTSAGVVLVGDYTTAAPTPEQQLALVQLLQLGKARGWWRAARFTGGHRDAPGASTACPGTAAHRLLAGINALAAGQPAAPTTAPKPTAPAVPTTGDDVPLPPTIRHGARGQHARNLQGLMVANGAPVDVDGVVGARTVAQLTAWQQRAGLAADGIAGPRTWRALIGV